MLSFAWSPRSQRTEKWTEIGPPRRGLPRLELGEAWRYRARHRPRATTLKLRYRRRFSGPLALVQPLAGLVIFTFVFGRLAKLRSTAPLRGLRLSRDVPLDIRVDVDLGPRHGAAAKSAPCDPRLLPTRPVAAAAVLPGLLDLAIAPALTAILLRGLRSHPGSAAPSAPGMDGRGGSAGLRCRDAPPR